MSDQTHGWPGFQRRHQLLWLTISVLLAAVAAASGALAPGNAASAWVYPGPDGKLVYKQTPAGDQIMDFSSAGYMGGGVPLPVVPVKRTVEPSGKGDDTAIIQAAIDEVAAMPLAGNFRGAVLLAPGVFTCSNNIVLPASGIVLRGSGSGPTGPTSTIEMSGHRHVAISTRSSGGDRSGDASEKNLAAHTFIADAYVPSGTRTFSVKDATGFSPGDVIEIKRPVTAAWVRFMGMDDMKCDGREQTWIRAGTTIDIERRIAAISGNRITLDVPLSDSFDSNFLAICRTAGLISRIAVRWVPATAGVRVGRSRGIVWLGAWWFSNRREP